MEVMRGYNEAQAMGIGDYEVLEPGGYICRILNAEERLSKSNKKMLCIYFDIAEGEHKDYYTRKFEDAKKNNNDPKKEIKYQGVYRQMLEGDNAVNYLKGTMTLLEQSNEGFKWNWNEHALAGLMFGGLFGIEEYNKQDGSIGKSTKLRFITTVKSIRDNDYKIPEDKLLPKQENPFATNTPVGTVSDDDLPF